MFVYYTFTGVTRETKLMDVFTIHRYIYIYIYIYCVCVTEFEKRALMAAYGGNNEFEIQVYLIKRSNFLLKKK